MSMHKQGRSLRALGLGLFTLSAIAVLVSPLHAQTYAASIQAPVGQGPQALAALDLGSTTLRFLAVGCPSINTVRIYGASLVGGQTVYTQVATVVPPVSGVPGFVPGEFGYSVLGIHDVDGDIINDFLVGAPGSTPQGAVYLVSGATFQVLRTLQSGSNLTSPCTGSSMRFGQSLAKFILTTNSYIAIGAPEFRRTSNCAQLDGLVEMWRTTTLPFAYTTYIKSSHGGDGLGRSMIQVQDTDDSPDTLPDLVIGTEGGNRAYLYSGGTVTGVNPSPVATFLGQPGEHLGYTVAECHVAGTNYIMLGAPYLEGVCSSASQLYGIPTASAVALAPNPASWSTALYWTPIVTQDIAVSFTTGSPVGMSGSDTMFLVGAPKMNSAGCGTGQFVLYDGSQAPPFMPQSTPTNFGSASNLFGTSVAYLGSQFILLGPHWYAVADPAATGGGLVWTFN